jgi:hypothetical protein
VALLLIAPMLETYQQIRRPLRHEQLTEVLAEMRSRVQPGDKVYLYYGAVPAFTFYTRDDPPGWDTSRGEHHREDERGYRDELRRFAGQGRVWLVFSHRHEGEEPLIRAYADCLGRRLQAIRRSGANAYLYDFGLAE